MDPLEEAIEFLRHIDQFKVVIEEIRSLERNAVRDVGNSDDPYKTQRHAGEVSAYEQILAMIER